MSASSDEETYSVIFAALKHPIRRKILRMLSEDELTYTQMLTRLGVDTGHLNYHLENLGELLSKTDDGKYRLSEFGTAALGLMGSVEETENRDETRKLRRSRRRITRWAQTIPVIALIAAGVLLLNVSYVSTSASGSSGSLDRRDARIIQPNATITSTDLINVRAFPSDTLTTRYRAFFQIDVAYTNVSLQVQLTEEIFSMGNVPAGVQAERYFQPPLLIYNETLDGPLEPENGVALTYTIRVPLRSPEEKGFSVANSFASYNTLITNLGKEAVINDSFGREKIVVLPNYTGSLSLQASYPVVEETGYPYFYYGVAFLILATITAALPYMYASIAQMAKRLTK